MANYYFDTSAFLKFYIEEDGSDTVQALLRDNESHTFIISDLTILEARSAIRRREREGSISAEHAANALEQIDEDAELRFLVQPQLSSMISDAAQHIDNHALRTLDSLQLAGCLLSHRSAYPPTTFVCADSRLRTAASREGLSTIDPLLPS